MGPYKPLRNWVEFPIPYCMEISWEFRPYNSEKNERLQRKDGSLEDVFSLFQSVDDFQVSSLHFKGCTWKDLGR